MKNLAIFFILSIALHLPGFFIPQRVQADDDFSVVWQQKPASSGAACAEFYTKNKGKEFSLKDRCQETITFDLCVVKNNLAQRCERGSLGVAIVAAGVDDYNLVKLSKASELPLSFYILECKNARLPDVAAALTSYLYPKVSNARILNGRVQYSCERLDPNMAPGSETDGNNATYYEASLKAQDGSPPAKESPKAPSAPPPAAKNPSGEKDYYVNSKCLSHKFMSSEDPEESDKVQIENLCDDTVNYAFCFENERSNRYVCSRKEFRSVSGLGGHQHHIYDFNPTAAWISDYANTGKMVYVACKVPAKPIDIDVTPIYRTAQDKKGTSFQTPSGRYKTDHKCVVK